LRLGNKLTSLFTVLMSLCAAVPPPQWL